MVISAATNVISERCERLNERTLRWKEAGVDPFFLDYEAYKDGRVLMDGRYKLMTGSSSYLGLAEDSRLTKAVMEAIETYGMACHGSQALSGAKAIHRVFEEELALFLGAPAALVFANGWLTNYTTISTLFEPGDSIISDVRNHNCIASGIQASGARLIHFKASDPKTLERALVKAEGTTTLVVLDAVFSMDGDIPPLPAIVELCKANGAMLMIDEAQSFGVTGQTGRGLVEHFDLDPKDIDIRTGTMSKVLSSSGGFVAADAEIIEALRHGSDGYLFTGAAPVTSVAAALASLRILAASPELVESVQKKCEYFRSRLLEAGFDVIGSDTPIIPVIYTSEDDMFRVVKEMYERDIFVLPAVYPAVPIKAPRIRFNVTNDMSDEDLDFLVDSFIEANRMVFGETAIDLR